MYVVNRAFDPVQELVLAYMNKGRNPGSGVRQRSLNEGIQYGYRQSVAEAIGLHLTLKRFEKYPLASNIELIDGWSVQKILEEFVEDWNTFDSENRARCLEILLDRFNELVAGDEKFQEGYAELRRQAYLDGKIGVEDLTMEDAEYFRQKLEESRQMARKLEELDL